MNKTPTKTKDAKPSLRQAMGTFGKLYCDENILANMPPATGKEVVLFNVGKYVTREELEAEYEKRELVPASPYDLAALHKKDKGLAEEKMHTATIFEVDREKCCAIFYRWHGGRFVYVYRDVSDWDDYWWFAGLRKSSELGTETSSGDLELSAAIARVKQEGYVIYKPL